MRRKCEICGGLMRPAWEPAIAYFDDGTEKEIPDHGYYVWKCNNARHTFQISEISKHQSQVINLVYSNAAIKRNALREGIATKDMNALHYYSEEYKSYLYHDPEVIK